jgi:hypothetical protein
MHSSILLLFFSSGKMVLLTPIALFLLEGGGFRGEGMFQFKIGIEQ